MNVAQGLVITSIFPNCQETTKGVYISKIVQAVSRQAPIHIIAPVPYCPHFMTSPQYARIRRIPRKEIHAGLAVEHPRYLVTPKIGRSLYGFFYFLSLLIAWRSLRKSFRPDYILAFWAYPDAFAAMLLARVIGVPVFTGCRGCDVNTAGQSLTRKIMVREALRKSARVFAVSHAMARVIANLGIDAHRISVVPNGIDRSQFFPIPRQLARTTISGARFEDAEKVVLFCGRLSEEKGILVLVEALRLCKLRREPIRLLLAGNGPLRPAILGKVGEYGLRDLVTFLDEVPHDAVPGLMCASDVLCLPSLREGWPNVVTEALACGTPVVAACVGGVPEILTSSEFGIMVPPGSSEQLAEALVTAVNTHWDREKITASSHARTWDAVASEMLNVIFCALPPSARSMASVRVEDSSTVRSSSVK